MKFIVDKKLFDNYKDLSVGVIVCHNINNKKDININKEYQEVKKQIKDKFSNIELSEYPIIKKWREVYKSFGEKKARSSIEALIRSSRKGKSYEKDLRRRIQGLYGLQEIHVGRRDEHE